MKRFIRIARGYLLPIWIFASLTAMLDTLYGVFAGSIFAEDVPSFLSLFSINTLLNLFLLLIIALLFILIYYLITLLFKGFREKENFLAFYLIPGFIILPLFLLSVVLNEKYLPYFFTSTSLIVNGVLLLFSIISGICIYFVRRRLFKLFDNKRLAILGYIFSAVTVLVFIIGFIFSLPETQRRGNPILNAPNVIIITVDALRQDRISVYTDEHVKTPTLDNFAKEAVVFDNGYTHAPWTIPSMYTMHTSRYPSVHGARIFDKGSSGIPLLAETLKDNGYRTEAYVANPILNGDLGFGEGFDKYVEYGDLESFTFFKKATLYRLLKRIRDTALPHLGVKGIDSTKWLTDITVRTLSTKKDAPLFLWVHYMDPHTPLTPPREYIEGDDDRKDELALFGCLAIADDYLLKEDDADKLVSLYNSEVRYVDAQLRRVFEMLSDKGYMEDSIIIVTSDHGEEHFEHGHYGHSRTHFEEVMSVPFIVYTPDCESGVCSYPVGLIDVKPTIIDYVGIELLPTLSGESLVKYIDDADMSYGERYIYYDQTAVNLLLKSTRMGEFTLIRDGDTDYSYTFIDNTKMNPNDIVSEPDSGLVDQYKEALDNWVIDTEIEKELLGDHSGSIEIDEERKKKLEDLGYI